MSIVELLNERRPIASTKVRITADGPFGELQPLEYVLDVNGCINSQIRRPGTLAEVAKDIKQVGNGDEVKAYPAAKSALILKMRSTQICDQQRWGSSGGWGSDQQTSNG